MIRRGKRTLHDKAYLVLEFDRGTSSVSISWESLFDDDKGKSPKMDNVLLSWWSLQERKCSWISALNSISDKNKEYSCQNSYTHSEKVVHQRDWHVRTVSRSISTIVVQCRCSCMWLNCVSSFGKGNFVLHIELEINLEKIYLKLL